MSFRMKIDGVKRLRRKIDRLPSYWQTVINDSLFDMQKKIITYIKDSITEVSIGTGSRLYRIYGKEHWSAAYGDAPNNLTGALRRSIKGNINKKKNQSVLIIGSSLEYAVYLEMGTSKMEARPFIKPAYLKFSPMITKELKNIINQYNRKIGKK